MKLLKIKLGKERQCHITKQLVHSYSVNIRITQPSKVMFTQANFASVNITVLENFASVNITVLGLTNPDVNLKRMHHCILLYDSYKRPPLIG